MADDIAAAIEEWEARAMREQTDHEAERDVLRALRPKANPALLAEARQDCACRVLRTIPFFGPVRVALLLATMQQLRLRKKLKRIHPEAGFSLATIMAGFISLLGILALIAVILRQ